MRSEQGVGLSRAAWRWEFLQPLSQVTVTADTLPRQAFNEGRQAYLGGSTETTHTVPTEGKKGFS